MFSEPLLPCFSTANTCKTLGKYLITTFNMTEWQDHSQTSSPSLAWPGITKVALCLHFLWAYTILLLSTLQNSLVTDEIPCRDDRTLYRSSQWTLPGERCTLQRARVCQKTAELLTDIFVPQMMLGSDKLNKKNSDLSTEFSFAFRMVFHLSPRNFYLKSFPCCTTGIPAQQRHFVVHVQSNNQSTKPATRRGDKVRAFGLLAPWKTSWPCRALYR